MDSCYSERRCSIPSTAEVAHLFAFRFEIVRVVDGLGDEGGDAFDDLDAGELESFDFFGVVGDEADGGDVELLEHLGGEFEDAAVGFVAEFEVGFDGVEALVLELVGAELGHESDAAALLLLVEEDAGAGLGDGGEGEFELLAAVAAERVEDVSGEALGVDADDGRGGVDVAHDECDGGFDAAGGCGDELVAGLRLVWFALDTFLDAFEAEDAEVAPTCREIGVCELGDAGEGHCLIIGRVMEGPGKGNGRSKGNGEYRGLSTSPSTRAARSGFGRDDGVGMWCDGECGW